MNRNILKRIDALEQRVKHQSIPDFIMVFYRDHLKSWVVQEVYGTDGNAAKFIERQIISPEEYVVPDGFSGTLIFDDLSGPQNGLEYEAWAERQQYDDADTGTEFNVVHRCYR